MDHTGRANTFAHHLLLDPPEQPPAGPAWVLSQPGVLDATWTGAPRTLPTGRPVPRGDDPPAVCDAWAAAAGDAGWAGVLADTVGGDGPRVAYLIYDPTAGHDPLALLRQAMALLPPARRWPVAFATYFTDLPAGLACHWRCCVAGTAPAKDARRHATSGVVLDLTQSLGDAPETALVQLARTGQAAVAAAATPAALFVAPAVATHTADVGPMAIDSIKPTPLPVGGPPERLTARRPLLVPFGVGPAGDRPLLPVGTPVGDYDDAPAANRLPVPPGKTRTWLWVSAFVWPVLVISASAVWVSMTTQSVFDRVAAARKPLQDEVSQLTASNGRNLIDLAAARRQQTQQANEIGEKNRNLDKANEYAQKQAAILASTQIDLEAMRASAKPKPKPSTAATEANTSSMLVSKPAPTVLTDQLAADVERLVAVDPLAANPVLFTSDVPIDRIDIVPGMIDKSFTSSLDLSTSSKKAVGIMWTGIDAVAKGSDDKGLRGIASDTIATIDIEKRMDAWVICWHWRTRPEDGSNRLNRLRAWLTYCGLEVVRGGGGPVMIGLGDPSSSYSVDAKNSLKLLNPGVIGQDPVLVVDPGKNEGWDMTFQRGNGLSVIVSHTTTGPQPDTTFAVTIDPKSNEISSTYSAALSKLSNSASQLETDQQLEQNITQKNNKRTEDAKRATPSPKDVELKSKDLINDEANIKTATQHKIDVGNTRLKLKNSVAAMQQLKPFVIRMRDTKNGLLLREITISSPSRPVNPPTKR